MPTSQKTQEIAAAFQRYVKSNDLSGIEKYTIEDLRRADHDFGWRDKNASHRLALKDRIKTLENLSEKRYQRKTRVVGYIVALAIAIIAVIIGAKYL